ncbi:hypothetical protein HYZ64_00920 [Candidatus Berkelbacteria bacterium]|nr:hypothetical protein [Candidatus Berkelbacteria bacterium]
MAKVMISIPDEILAELDIRAKKEYETRSGFIRERLLSDFHNIPPRAKKTDLPELLKAFDEARKLKWSFPSGITYQRNIRKEWETRLKRQYGRLSG